MAPPAAPGQAAYLQHGRHHILFDPVQASDPLPQWFEPDWWARQGRHVQRFHGRSAVDVLRHGRALWVLRPYRRGGWVGRLVAERYLWAGLHASRPWREWRLLAELFERGLPVPRPVAAHVERFGLSWRGHLLTELIPGASTLLERMRRGDLGPADWQALGATLARFHAARVHHPDLNVKNLLCRADGSFCLIDFDKGRLDATASRLAADLQRLRRSIDKQRRLQPALRFAEADWDALLQAYRGAPARR